MEIYERIEGYEHHEVSNLGNVRRIKTKIVLKLRHLDLMSFYKYGPLMFEEGYDEFIDDDYFSKRDEHISLTPAIRRQIQRLKDMCSNSETDSDDDDEHESDSIRRERNRNDNFDSDSEDFCDCDCDE
jgi:hypothetical protein